MTTYDTLPYGASVNAKDTNSFTSCVADKFSEAGINWMRWQISQRNQRNYGWQRYDNQAALCRSHPDIKVDLVLQNFSTLQTGCTQMPTIECAVNWALELLGRYGDIIDCIEVCNEESSFEGTPACKTVDVYVPILLAVASALRGAGYTGLIGAFGFTNYNTAQEIFDWYNAFYGHADNPGHEIDAAGLHFYHHGVSPYTTLADKPSLPDCIEAHYTAALAHNHGEKPLWLGEFGYCCTQFGSSDCSHPVSAVLQSQYLREVLDICRTSNIPNSPYLKCDHAFWYTLGQENYGFNIVNHTDCSPSVAYTDWKNYIAIHPAWR